MFKYLQDAPAHNAIIIWQYLNDIFPNQWIGSHGIISWPTWSLDLSPFMGTLEKTVVHVDPPINSQYLKNEIRLISNSFSEDRIIAATSNIF